jgi:hypothetical protein
MMSSGLLRHVALVRTDVSEEPGASFIRVKKYQLVFLRSVRRLLVAACVVPSSPIFVTLMKETPGSSKTSVFTRATWRNNPEDIILHSHRRENLKSFKNQLYNLKRFKFKNLKKRLMVKGSIAFKFQNGL